MTTFARGSSVILLFLSLFASLPALAALPEDLVIGNYTQVSEKRVARTVWDYEYKAKITNTGSIDVTNVNASLVSKVPSTVVVDGQLSSVCLS